MEMEDQFIKGLTLAFALWAMRFVVRSGIAAFRVSALNSKLERIDE